jgi:UDP-N-acetylmuramoyl-tripeptide--D-alanyl-D-alanine ligase
LRAGGAWIIDDSYNANPSSVQAGIDVLAQLDGQRWLVFADMGELGDYATESHRQVGVRARAAGIERLFATGTLAQLAVESFGPGASWFADTRALAAALGAELSALGPESCAAVRMLVKGSRFNRLEHVVAALVAAPAGSGTQGA